MHPPSVSPIPLATIGPADYLYPILTHTAMPGKASRIIGILVCLLVAAIGIIIIIASTSDSSPKEDQGAAVDRDGSVETAISVQHADSTHDVIVTTHKVWVKFDVYSTIIHRDTVPALDTLTTDTENGNGVTQKVRVKKDYQLFITVK
jgi:hypothetical protein